MNDQDKVQRIVLPIPDQPRTGLVTYDAKDPETKFPPIRPLRPPKGAPNVLVVLIDDAGFGSSSAFGGPCNTPTAEQLAARGLKYNRFHTTALCSPTRQALLTGRNHHTVGMGGITEIATGSPGYNSVLPNTCSPIARTLKLNGYATAQFGKCHEVPVWETSPAGPFDAWPTGGGGFEYFYGFIGGEANQWYPSLYEGTTPIEVKRTPEEGYHLMEDMTDKAMSWIGQQYAVPRSVERRLARNTGVRHPTTGALGWTLRSAGKPEISDIEIDSGTGSFDYGTMPHSNILFAMGAATLFRKYSRIFGSFLSIPTTFCLVAACWGSGGCCFCALRSSHVEC